MTGDPARIDDIADVVVEDVEYARHDGEPMLARVHRPRGPGPFPLVGEVHGGAWCRGDRTDEDRLNRALARRGIVVAALDFRMPPRAGYPASIADLNLAVRWLKTRAAAWGARADRVGLMGVSSGAHQAVLAAMRPDDPRYAALPCPEAAPGVDARVAFVVACWPVIDPVGRYRYALELQRAGGDYPEAIDRVIPDHLRYWGDEAAMAEGSPLRALERGEPADLPPVLCVQGEADRVHPRAHLERFVDAWRRAGGRARVEWHPDEAESFVNRKPEAASTARAIASIARFVRSGGADIDPDRSQENRA